MASNGNIERNRCSSSVGFGLIVVLAESTLEFLTFLIALFTLRVMAIDKKIEEKGKLKAFYRGR